MAPKTETPYAWRILAGDEKWRYRRPAPGDAIEGGGVRKARRDGTGYSPASFDESA